MISPSKKPKRLHGDGIEECSTSACSTPVKKQKGHCETFITSSPCFNVEKEHKSKISQHATLSNAILALDSTSISVSDSEPSSSFFSASLKFHQKGSESEIVQVVAVEGQGYLEEAGLTKVHHIQDIDTWYNFPKGAVEEVDDVEEEFAEFNPYLFIKNLPAHQPALRTLLPPRLSSDPKVCLVLDLDETLVHCSTEMLLPADLVFPVVFNNIEYTVFARKRPFIEEFLSQMATLFEIVVFTASQEVYADRLLNILDPDRKYIRHRLFRDSCICVEGNYLKDLTILGRDLSKVIIVDNSPQAFGYQIDNGIPIESWFDDDADQELMRLVPFLESIINEPDVRPLIREKFKLYELISKL